MAQKYYQKAGVQTAIIVGLFSLAGLFLTGIGYVCSDRFLQAPPLRKEVDSLKEQKASLERQIDPFIALTSQKKYTGNETQQLQQLVTDMRKAQDAITSRQDKSAEEIKSHQERETQKILAALEQYSRPEGPAKGNVLPPVAAQPKSAAVEAYDKGKALLDKGDYASAIATYTEAIRLKPDFAEAYCNRGTTYNNKGDFDKGIADFNEAIRIIPDFAHAYFGRGIAYGNKGECDKAIADYNKSIRLDPKNARVYWGRGLAYRNKGDFEKAIADYNESIRLDPKNALVYNDRGFAYIIKVHPTKAYLA